MTVTLLADKKDFISADPELTMKQYTMMLQLYLDHQTVNQSCAKIAGTVLPPLSLLRKVYHLILHA